MQLKNKCIIPIRYTVFLSLVGAMIGVGVYGCKKEEPVTEDTAPTESVEQEPTGGGYDPSKKPVSLEEKLYKQCKITFQSNRDGNPEIYVMNADGSEQRNLTNNPGSEHLPSWSPDGKKLAFWSNRDGNPEIYVMNADGSEQKRLTNNPATDWHPSWSPDGKKIAFGSTRDGNQEIYVMNADGSEQKNLTNNPAKDYSPSWSPFLPLENKTNEKK